MSISIFEALKYCKKMSFQGSLTEKTPTGRFNRLTNQSVLSRFHTHPMRKIDDTGISLKESSEQKNRKKTQNSKRKNRNSGVFRQSIGPTKGFPQGKKQNWKNIIHNKLVLKTAPWRPSFNFMHWWRDKNERLGVSWRIFPTCLERWSNLLNFLTGLN